MPTVSVPRDLLFEALEKEYSTCETENERKMHVSSREGACVLAGWSRSMWERLCIVFFLRRRCLLLQNLQSQYAYMYM